VRWSAHLDQAGGSSSLRFHRAGISACAAIPRGLFRDRTDAQIMRETGEGDHFVHPVERFILKRTPL
jgi:hypothetical protein